MTDRIKKVGCFPGYRSMDQFRRITAITEDIGGGECSGAVVSHDKNNGGNIQEHIHIIKDGKNYLVTPVIDERIGATLECKEVPMKLKT